MNCIRNRFHHPNFVLKSLFIKVGDHVVEIEIVYDITMDFEGNEFREITAFMTLFEKTFQPYFTQVLALDHITVGEEEWRVNLKFLDENISAYFKSLSAIESKKDLARLRLEDESGDIFGFARFVLQDWFETEAS